MPIPQTNEYEFAEHVRRLGIKNGDSIAVHAKVSSFGILQGGLEMFLNVLKQAVGASGNIAAPTYTFQLTESDVYDPERSPSHKVGVFSELFRKQAGVVRSRCPIHNHAVLGPLSTALNQVTGKNSLGPGSDFEWLADYGFKLVLLGCKPSEGATFLHHLEAVARVPYREEITLRRKIQSEPGAVELIDVRYYSRKKDSVYRESFDSILPDLQLADLLTTVECALGESYSILLSDLRDFVLGRLSGSPLYLVTR